MPVNEEQLEAIETVRGWISDQRAPALFHLAPPFVSYGPGDGECRLDGDFTLAELKALVAYMDAHE